MEQESRSVDGLPPAGSLRLFVVHAPADAWFVDGFLLEALRLAAGEVLVSIQLEPGAVIVREIERGVLSPVTVVVVSPAFLASQDFRNRAREHWGGGSRAAAQEARRESA